MKSCLEAVHEMCKLIKKSPKRDSMFERLKAQVVSEEVSHTLGIRVLCPTRWTIRAASVQSMLDNYEILLEVWEESKASSLDSEIRARIIGVEAQMEQFDFFLDYCLLLSC